MADSIKNMDLKSPGHLKQGEKDPLKINSGEYLHKAIHDLAASKAILARLISS